MTSANTNSGEATMRFRQHVNTMAILGVAIVLLTAVAQTY